MFCYTLEKKPGRTGVLSCTRSYAGCCFLNLIKNRVPDSLFSLTNAVNIITETFAIIRSLANQSWIFKHIIICKIHPFFSSVLEQNAVGIGAQKSRNHSANVCCYFILHFSLFWFRPNLVCFILCDATCKHSSQTSVSKQMHLKHMSILYQDNESWELSHPFSFCFWSLFLIMLSFIALYPYIHPSYAA